jgi:hypothetical protein
VKHFLASLLLPQYESTFLNSGYDTLAKCATLTDASLLQIGIQPVGHRKRILTHLPKLLLHTDSSKHPADDGFMNKSHTATTDVEDNDDSHKEIYDIPPPVRLKPAPPQKRESTYLNILELNQIPRPILPPKRQTSSTDVVNIKLGITSPSVSEMSPSSSPVFDTSSVGCGRASPKLCIVHPEKRLPVPLPRPTSETIISPQQSVRPSPGEVLPTAVRPLPKPRISRLVNIPILSTPVAGQTDRKNLTEKPDDVTNNKILMGIEATPSTELVTVGTVGSSQSDSVCGVVSTVKKT